MHQLPPLPDTIRVLTADESERLDTLYPNLPKSLTDCVTCGGKKKFLWYEDYGTSEDRNVVEYECPCSDQFILHKYLLNAGVLKSGQRLALGDCIEVDEKALDAAAEYLESADYYVNRGIGMIFHGTHGSGKTLLSTIMLKQLLGVGIDGYFTTFTNLLDNFAAGWRDDKNRAWFERRVRNAALLVVDDIGREMAGRNSMASASLDNVFRSRVQDSLPTIVTTNLSMHDFEQSYSTGVMSLVSETSLSYEFAGRDFRPTQRDRNRKEAMQRLSRPITLY